MSVITQRGDSGETDLMYGRRVSKTHPRIIANGSLDELNAVLGIARTQARLEGYVDLESRLSAVQNQLILAMGEILRKGDFQIRLEVFTQIHGFSQEFDRRDFIGDEGVLLTNKVIGVLK